MGNELRDVRLSVEAREEDGKVDVVVDMVVDMVVLVVDLVLSAHSLHNTHGLSPPCFWHTMGLCTNFRQGRAALGLMKVTNARKIVISARLMLTC